MSIQLSPPPTPQEETGGALPLQQVHGGGGGLGKQHTAAQGSSAQVEAVRLQAELQGEVLGELRDQGQCAPWQHPWGLHTGKHFQGDSGGPQEPPLAHLCLQPLQEATPAFLPQNRHQEAWVLHLKITLK